MLFPTLQKKIDKISEGGGGLVIFFKNQFFLILFHVLGSHFMLFPNKN